jgi:hypothetical protein
MDIDRGYVPVIVKDWMHRALVNLRVRAKQRLAAVPDQYIILDDDSMSPVVGNAMQSVGNNYIIRNGDVLPDPVKGVDAL